MNKNLNVFIASGPEDYKAVSSKGFPFACMGYRLLDSGVIIHRAVPEKLRGCVMVIDDAELANISDELKSKIAGVIFSEAVRRSFSGVLLDFEKDESRPVAESIVKLLSSQNIPVCIPAKFSALSNDARILLPLAVSGGSLSAFLDDILASFPPSRLVIEIPRICADFSIPATDPDGKRLSQEELTVLISEHRANIFFSRDLCAKYFTYRDKNADPHFVLFDDASTLKSKLYAVAARSIGTALVLYNEASDLLPIITDKIPLLNIFAKKEEAASKT